MSNKLYLIISGANAEAVAVGVRLPDDLDRVPGDLGVGGDDGQTLDLALGDEDAVEGIAVVEGQADNVQGVSYRDRQICDGVEHQLLLNEPRRLSRQFQFPHLCLENDFPGAGRAQEELVACIQEQPSNPGGHSALVECPPQEGVRIE